MTTVRINQSALRALEDGPELKAALDSVGAQVADRARQAAPKDSGDGAASIAHEVGQDSEGAFVHVSWDRVHFYMAFPELGTSHQSARPFLRPALDATYTL